MKVTAKDGDRSVHREVTPAEFCSNVSEGSAGYEGPVASLREILFRCRNPINAIRHRPPRLCIDSPFSVTMRTARILRVISPGQTDFRDDRAGRRQRAGDRLSPVRQACGSHGLGVCGFPRPHLPRRRNARPAHARRQIQGNDRQERSGKARERAGDQPAHERDLRSQQQRWRSAGFVRDRDRIDRPIFSPAAERRRLAPSERPARSLGLARQDHRIALRDVVEPQERFLASRTTCIRPRSFIAPIYSRKRASISKPQKPGRISREVPAISGILARPRLSEPTRN